MNKLSILLLIYLLSVGTVNAALAEPNDVSFGPSDLSNNVLDISYDDTNQTTLSKFPQTSSLNSEADDAPPSFWIVGLGLCLIFLGYKIKTKRK